MTRWRWGLIAWAVTALVASSAAAQASATWYVRAGAGPGGEGTRGSPFGDLAQVEAASDPGDRIVVLRAARSAGTLDGGIELKRGQRLIGAGPPVARGDERERAPRLT